MIFKNVETLTTNSTTEKIQWFKKHQHLCSKPFNNAQIRMDPNMGKISVNPCCNYREPEQKLLSVDQQFASLRDDIVNGIKNTNCETCYNVEKFNDYSERIREMMPWSESQINEWLTTGKTRDFSFGIKFSNFCNLACRSCDSSLSSTYATLTNKPVASIESTDISQTSEWNNILDFTKILSDQYEMIHIGLIGGETMVQKGASQYIEYLASLEKVNNIVLRITSNFTTIDQTLLQHMNKFRRVDLTASIDSAGENYHYVRWPAQFKKIQNNLAEYQKIRDQSQTITTLTIASVFGLNNIFYIKEYLDFLQDQLTQCPDIMINVLHLSTPIEQSIENLPVQYRPMLQSYVQQALQHPVLTHPNAKSMQIFLQGVESFLSTDLVPHDCFANYLKFTADFDRRTNCYFKDFNQRLYEILSATDVGIYQQYLTKDISNDHRN